MMTNHIKYQVFLSSTYTDLIQERKDVVETILKLYHFPIGMEMFSADNREQWKVIEATIDTSDIYVLIIGHRFGSLTKRKRISYTQQEFEYAKKRSKDGKLQVLCFIRDPNYPISEDKLDSEPELRDKLKSFRKVVQNSGLTVDFWSSSDELSKKVGISLSKCIQRLSLSGPSFGWVKSNGNLDNHFWQDTDVAQNLSTLKKFLTSACGDFETENEDIDTYIVDHKGNCRIERIRTQHCNCDVTHTLTKFIIDKKGNSKIRELIDLNTGNNLSHLPDENGGTVFSFFILFDNIIKSGQSIKYRCCAEVANYLSSLVDYGVGYLGYKPFSKTTFRSKKDVIIFPNTPRFKDVNVTLIQLMPGELLNVSVVPKINVNQKIFYLDYGSLNSSNEISVEIRLNK
jgi:uncharacterized Fe-S cluster-containing protein